MQAQPTAHPDQQPAPALFPDTTANGVRVVDGYGIKISVQHGRLRIEDGVGRQRRSDVYSRATCPFRRLLVLGHSGFVTVNSLRWCSRLGIGVVQLDTDGTVLVTTAQREIGTNRLRRVQALAPYTAVGLEAARLIMAEKIRGQRSLLQQLPGGERARPAMDSALETCDRARTLDEVLEAESGAARAYWQCWATIPVLFAYRDRDQVRDHWRAFGTRTSVVSGTRRHAAAPAGALLNYLYALLEVETTLALHASALDPALGIWHADERHRDSASLDTMEAGRPTVDRYVLDLLEQTTFRARDFHETADGTCRILPPLTHRLAEAMPALAAAVAPVVIELGRLFDRTVIPDAAPVRFGKPRRSEHRRPTPATRYAPFPSLARCAECGDFLPLGDVRKYCTTCRPARVVPPAEAVAAARHNVSQARRDTLSQRRRAATAWDRAHLVRPDPAEFASDILPGLQGVSVSGIARATGLSRRYCKLIVRGEAVPHPMHWDAFRAVAAQSVEHDLPEQTVNKVVGSPT